MSTEVVGTAEADATAGAVASLLLDRPRPLVRTTTLREAARAAALLGPAPVPSATRTAATTTTARPPTPPPPPPRTGRLTPRRRIAALIAAAALVGTALGWSGAGTWQQAQRRSVLIDSAEAAAAVVSVDTTVGGLDGSDEALGLRRAVLVVSVVNLGGVPLDVLVPSGSFDAARIRSVDPAYPRVEPGARITVRLLIEVGCASPQRLRVPPLQVVSPAGLNREVPLDATAPALAELCSHDDRGVAALVESSTGRGRSPVSDLIDDGRLRVPLRAPSGRTTRVVGVRVGGLRLTGEPLPSSVDGTERVIWLDQPTACDPSVTRSGVPRALDVDVDAGAGQVATVRVPIGDALATWLLAGPCGKAAP